MSKKKSSREDGRGHWPKGKTRNEPAEDWPQVQRSLERLLRNPEYGGAGVAVADLAKVRSRRGLSAALGVSDRQVRRWLAGEDMPGVDRVGAIKQWMASIKAR